MRPRRVLGVDFSGASDAGRKIWIAELKRGRGRRLTLVDLVPAAALPDSGIAPRAAIAALARHILREPSTIVGCDFPFTLPKAVMDAPWEAFVAEFAQRFDLRRLPKHAVAFSSREDAWLKGAGPSE